MRNLFIFSFLILTISFSTSPVMAQTEIVPLGEAISDLTEQDIAGETGAGDVSAQIDAALDSAMVADALAQGLITQEEAGSLNQALDIIEANIDNFDFDIQAMIAEALENGDVSLQQVTETLNAFDQLSDAGKAIVGQDTFSPINGQGDLSDADWAVIQSVSDNFGSDDPTENPSGDPAQ